jgi:hypothetical protein
VKPGIAAALLPERPYLVPIDRRELLPFRVRLAESTQDIHKAVEIRAAAYARHIPEMGAALREPESDDLRDDALLLLAEGKLDRDVVGSLRLQPNFNRPLRIEGEVSLPESHRGRRLVEARRLGVDNGSSGRMVMVALVKAAFELCHASGIDFVVVAGRRSVATMYRTMLFDDVLGGATIDLSYAESLPHSVFSMPVADADRRWRTTRHGLYDFMARTEHPDIAIDYDRVFAAFGQP